MPGEDFLNKKLEDRKQQHAFRSLRLAEHAAPADFCSNDYLGIATGGLIEAALKAETALHPGIARRIERGSQMQAAPRHGSMGSRLLAGNYPAIEDAERQIAGFHDASSGLIFNSGYDANLGLLSCVPQRGDTVFYDQLSHASIRDGIRLSFAQSHSFSHNDPVDLAKRLAAAQGGNRFVVTESVFSMDGDQAPLEIMIGLCREHHAHLIVDEAHATGVIGLQGAGLVQALGLADKVFARIHTFGKALGCHGAILLGSLTLRDFLINFCRPFIFTTALPEASIQAIRKTYELFPFMDKERVHLRNLIDRFQQAHIPFQKGVSSTAIQIVFVPGNEAVRTLSARLQAAGLDVRPILYPTVPRGGERLRIVLHAFNTEEELEHLIEELTRAGK